MSDKLLICIKTSLRWRGSYTDDRYDMYGNAGWQITLGVNDTNESYSRARLTRSKILDPNTNIWTEEEYYYDAYGRVTKKWSYIPELGTTKVFLYEYDLAGRLLNMSYQPQNCDTVQGVDYRYTIRDWLKMINHQNKKVRVSRKPFFYSAPS